MGESGCGKSTVAKLLMTLEPPTAGQVFYKGQDITRLSGRALRAVRRNIQMVFQDPYTSLNPRMTVGDIIGEPFEIHPEVAPKGDRRRAVREILEVVGLNPEYINRYPAPVLRRPAPAHRHRARGLALGPEVIVADEPVSALDVSVQAQVVNLMERLQDEFGLAYVFIAHDLSVVRHIADRVAVMYLGQLRRDRHRPRDLRPPHPPVHPGPALRRPGARPRGPHPPDPHPAPRRRPLPGEPALRLPLPHPLLEGAGPLRDGDAGAGGAEWPRWPRRPRLGLPLRGGARGGQGMMSKMLPPDPYPGPPAYPGPSPCPGRSRRTGWTRN
ncbi:Vitamin B12 import ATP-binding protein BtuD [Streptomyces antimycoticus]